MYRSSQTFTICEIDSRTANEKPNYDNCTEITGFSAGLYESKFGSFNNALREAGYEPSLERNVSDERLLDYLQEFSSNGRAKYDEMNENGTYSARLYEQRFGSWDNALREAGLNTRDRSGDNNPSWSGGLKEVVCKYCDDTYELPPSKANNSTFCSMSCKNTWQEDNMSGENNPAWIGGHEKYRGKSWSSAQRQVRKRDNSVCQHPDCTKTSEDIGRKLDVHHIIPFRYFDNHKNANGLENLVLLCPEHHSELDAQIWTIEKLNQNS